MLLISYDLMSVLWHLRAMKVFLESQNNSVFEADRPVFPRFVSFDLPHQKHPSCRKLLMKHAVTCGFCQLTTSKNGPGPKSQIGAHLQAEISIKSSLIIFFCLYNLLFFLLNLLIR